MQELLKHFHELSLLPKNAKDLKGLILELAIQGKLSADWRARHPELVSGSNHAENLLNEIKEEKMRLAQEKKIKAEKPFPKINEDEIPYELPQNWVWCRLIEVSEYIQRGKSPKYSEEPKIPVVSQKCVQWSGFDISRAKFIDEKSLEKYTEERFLCKGDLLWNSTGHGTIGRTILFPETTYEKVVADSHVTVVRSMKKHLLPDYLWIFTASPLIQNAIEGRVSGSTNQTELSTSTVKLLEFSLPPLTEQKEIIRLVETLFKKVEDLENLTENRIEIKNDYAASALNQLVKNDSKKEWQAIKHQFHTFFNEFDNIKKLRGAILQLAVQGELTAKWRSQNPDLISGKNSAENLLKEIKTEKTELIKEKKIKKEKSSSPISEDEILFELPKGWVWCRLMDVSEYIQRGKSPKYTEATKIPVISQKCVQWSGFDISKARFITEESLEKYQKERFLLEGDLLWNSTGDGTIGRTTLFPKVDYDQVVADSHVTVVRPLRKFLNSDFLWIFSASPLIQNLIENRVSGSTKQTELGTGTVKTLQFMFPPLEEQKEVVQKVNTLMHLCDQLEEEIETAQKQIEDLMKSVLKEGFGGEKKEETPLALAAEPEISYSHVKEEKINKITNIDYYKRMLLAAEITHQLIQDRRFGRLKLQKILYLCQESQNMNLPLNFQKQAMGPYDTQLAYSLEKQFLDKRWFKYNPDNYPKFSALENCGQHQEDYLKYFEAEDPHIQWIISLFRNFDSRQTEAIGTLYACWNDIVKKNHLLSDKLIIKKFYDWSEHKKSFKEEDLINGLEWMREKGLYPKA